MWVTFLIAFGFSLPSIWILRRFGNVLNLVVQPDRERWHRVATPWLGGVGIVLSMTMALGLSSWRGEQVRIDWVLLASPFFVFLVGLVDDIKPLPPVSKFLGQSIPAVMVIFLGGYQINFFPWPVANILLTLFWLFGITNAINLLDNMDGIAGGVALIAGVFLSYFSLETGSNGLVSLSASLAGSILGFLILNFPPAKIFMGDSGSLFIGFVLAELAVARRTSASNVLSVIGVPVLVFFLPILDTTLVTVTRLFRRQSPFRGGKDHSSHRLISFGLTERQVALTMYAAAILSGLGGMAIEALDYDFSLALIPVFILALVLFTAYLGRVQVIPSHMETPPETAYSHKIEVVGGRFLELLLDLGITTFSYYLAFWLWFGFDMTPESVSLYLESWPIVVFVLYGLGYIIGLYRNVWSFYTSSDLFRQFFTAAGSSFLSFGFLLILHPSSFYPYGVFVFYALILFMGLVSSRSAFFVIDKMISRSALRSEAETAFIYGSSAELEIELRLLEKDSGLAYIPVGIIDNQPQQWGRLLRNVKILGGIDQLAELATQFNVDGVIVSEPKLLEDENGKKLIQICRESGLWVRILRVNLYELEDFG